MSRSISFETTLNELEVLVEASVTPGCKGSPQTMDGPGDPDEPPQAEDVTAYLVRKDKKSGKPVRLDITDFLGSDDLEYLADLALETVGEREQSAREEAAERRGEEMRERARDRS